MYAGARATACVIANTAGPLEALCGSVPCDACDGRGIEDVCTYDIQSAEVAKVAESGDRSSIQCDMYGMYVSVSLKIRYGDVLVPRLTAYSLQDFILPQY